MFKKRSQGSYGRVREYGHAALTIQRYYRGYRCRKQFEIIKQTYLDDLINEQEQMYEQLRLQMEEDLDKFAIKPEESKYRYEDLPIKKPSMDFHIPMGYKQQIAALRVQKHLRGYLSRKLVQLLKLAQQKQNRYKRLSIECSVCMEKFVNKSQLEKHIKFNHNTRRHGEQDQHQDLNNLQSWCNQNFYNDPIGSNKKNDQLTTPFKKLRISKKQYQQWSDKIKSQIQSISNSSVGLKSPEPGKGLAQKELLQQQYKSASSLSEFRDREHNSQKQNVSLEEDDNSEMRLSDYAISSIKPANRIGVRSSIEISPSLKSDLLKEFSEVDRRKFHQRVVPELISFNKLQQTKQFLHFTPKSQRLSQPVVYEFDIYIRAAKEVQRFYRGFMVRKKLFGSFKKFKQRLVRLQRVIRKFLAKRHYRYQQYLEYLELKSKKIVANMKNFYKIHQKFDKMRLKPSSNDRSMIKQADKQKLYLEKSYQQVHSKHSKQHRDMQIQTTQAPVDQNSDKDHLIQSLRNDVQALKLLLYRDITSTLNFNHQSIDPKEQSLSHQGTADLEQYKSLQLLKERLNSMQKTQIEQDHTRYPSEMGHYVSRVHNQNQSSSLDQFSDQHYYSQRPSSSNTYY